MGYDIWWIQVAEFMGRLFFKIINLLAQIMLTPSISLLGLLLTMLVLKIIMRFWIRLLQAEEKETTRGKKSLEKAGGL